MSTTCGPAVSLADLRRADTDARGHQKRVQTCMSSITAGNRTLEVAQITVNNNTELTEKMKESLPGQQQGRTSRGHTAEERSELGDVIHVTFTTRHS